MAAITQGIQHVELRQHLPGRLRSGGATVKFNNVTEFAGKWAAVRKLHTNEHVLQVAFDAGAKRLLMPMACVKDIPTIPGELFAKFQTGFYADASDAVFKARGVG